MITLYSLVQTGLLAIMATAVVALMLIGLARSVRA